MRKRIREEEKRHDWDTRERRKEMRKKGWIQGGNKGKRISA